MKGWLAALLVMPILAAPAAAETLHFRSATWPPTPLQLRLAKAGGGASVDVVMDAYGALLHLARLPFIDPERIALVGYSFGAAVALSAVEFDGPERLFDRQFAAAIAYYPSCPDKLAVSVPTIILAGALDDWAPPRFCQRMMARRSNLGASLKLVVYPDARHAFNLPLPPRRHYGYHLEYDEAADRAARKEAAALLRQAFGR